MGTSAFFLEQRLFGTRAVLLMKMLYWVSWQFIYCFLDLVSSRECQTTWCFWAPRFLQLSLWFSWQMLKHRHSQLTPQWQHRCRNWKKCSYSNLGRDYTDAPNFPTDSLYIFFPPVAWWLRLGENESLSFLLIQSPIHTPKKLCRSEGPQIRGILAIILGSSLFFGEPSSGWATFGFEDEKKKRSLIWRELSLVPTRLFYGLANGKPTVTFSESQVTLEPGLRNSRSVVSHRILPPYTSSAFSPAPTSGCPLRSVLGTRDTQWRLR